MSPLKEPCRAITKFKAQFKIIELIEERPVLTAGYKCVIHLHTAIEECEISQLLEVRNLKTKKVEQKPKFARQDNVLTCVITLARPVALDAFTGCEKLGRFTLRDEGITIGIGKVTSLPAEKDDKKGKK